MAGKKQLKKAKKLQSTKTLIVRSGNAPKFSGN
jgi:hypothetical protein